MSILLPSLCYLLTEDLIIWHKHVRIVDILKSESRVKMKDNMIFKKKSKEEITVISDIKMHLEL